MIWIFDDLDRLIMIANNENPDALPVLSATFSEVLNGDYLLDFEVPLDHRNADLIQEGNSCAIQRDDGEFELFIITEIQETKANEARLAVSCRHAVQELADDILLDYLAVAGNADTVLPAILAGTRWEAGTIQNTEPQDYSFTNTPVLAALTDFIKIWGGEIDYSFTITSAGITERKINFYPQKGTNAGRRFEWTRDLLEIKRTVNVENVKTALIGVGKLSTTVTPPPPDPDPMNVNLLIQEQRNPTTISALRSWTKSNLVAEAISTDVPAGVEKVTRSLVATQSSGASDYMVINNADKKTKIKPNKTYTASVYIKCNGARDISLWLEFYPNGAKPIKTYEKRIAVSANVWTRVSITQVSPDKTYTAMLEARVYAPVSGTTLQWAGAKLEQGNLTAFGLAIDDDPPEPYEVEGDLYFTDVVWTTPTNPAAKPAGQIYVEDPVAKALYGRIIKDTGTKRNRMGFYTDSEITDATILLENTWEALQLQNKPQVTYTLKVLDLAKLEGKLYKMIYLGDTNAIIDDELGLQLLSRCLEIKHDLIEKENTEILLESFQATFTGGDGKIGVQDPSIRLDQIEVDLKNKITEGDIIKTSWLESEMSELLDRISAGRGTVTMDDEKGILIEEDPEGKLGGALLLTGGVLALAQNYDFRIADYNWRAFGTGEGFLADLVETGFIKFDRAQGGTLTLGGEITGYKTSESVQTITMEGKVKGDDDTDRLIKYGAVTSEQQPVNLTSEVNAGYANVSFNDTAYMSWYATLANQYVQYDVEITLETLELLEQIEFKVIGKLGMPFTLRPYKTTTWIWDTSKTITFDGLTTDPVSLILGADEWANYQTGGTFRFSIMTTTKLAADGYLSLDINYLELNATYTERLTDPVYQNGTMIVKNSAGAEVMQLTGDKGGFDSLFIGEVSGNNVVTKNFKGETNYYIDPINGSDINDGLDPTRPLLSIQTAINRLNIFNNDIIYLRVLGEGITWTESISLEGFMGSGKIALEFGKRNTMRGEIYVGFCQCEVNISTLQGSYTSTAATGADRAQISEISGDIAPVYAYGSNFVYVTDMILNANNLHSYGIYANRSYIRQAYLEVYNATYACCCAAYGATVDVVDCAGSAPRGLYLYRSAFAAGSSRGYWGTLASSHIVASQGAYCGASWTYTIGSIKPVYAGSKITSWTPNDTGSWWKSGGWASNYIYQGKRPTETPIWYGVAFFNTRDFSALKNPDLSNRPITKVRLKLKRSNNTGTNNAKQPRIFYNAQTSKGSTIATLKNGFQTGISFNWGETRWINLPTTFGTAFQSGAAKSIVLYDGSNTSDYMRFETAVTLEITHG